MSSATQAQSSCADVLAAARRFRALGFSVIPVDHPAATKEQDLQRIGKVPAIGSWKAFQTAPASDDNLRSWFSNRRLRNIGIVTGAVSGIVVVDTDNAEAEGWAAHNLPPTPLVTKTAKGFHRFYRHPKHPVKTAAHIEVDAGLTLDVRGDGGFVVAPGSVHSSGVTYLELSDWPQDLSSVPIFNPSWLERIRRPANTSAARPKQNAPLRLASSNTTTRARRYMGGVPPAIQGQGGDAHTYRVACILVWDFALSKAEAWPLFQEWNRGCQPPWSDADLEAKLDRALKYGTGALGSKLDSDRYESGRQVRYNGSEAPTAEAAEVTAAPVVDGAPDGQSRVFANSDSGNAEFFASRNRNHLRYLYSRKAWFVWNGHRWRQDDDGEVGRLAKSAIRARLHLAADLEDACDRKPSAKWAFTSEAKGRLDALLSLARMERPLAESGRGFDEDPWLLGVPNGVLDLETGTLRPGERDDRITMSCAVPYDADAVCPRWEQVIADIFPTDELRRYFHKSVGYSLTGFTSEQCLWILHGTGGNGKSLVMNTIRETLGDYGYVMPFSTIEQWGRSSIPTDLAALVGRRFVVASETNEGSLLNEARVKSLTGSDPITARRLYQDEFTFQPVGKFWLAVNHRPRVKDNSPGFWRRVRLVPFEKRFPLNAALPYELQAERAGILRWAVAGCLLWLAEGLQAPAEVLAATHEFEADSDPLRDFLEQECVLEPSAETGAAELYGLYKRWADRCGLSDRERFSSTLFGRRIGDRFKKRRTAQGVFYEGVAPARNEGFSLTNAEFNDAL